MTKPVSLFSEQAPIFFRQNGFVRSQAPVFSEIRFNELKKLVNLILSRNPAPGEYVRVENLLFKIPSFLDFIIEENVLDMVESLLGPSYGLSSSSSFVKLPNSGVGLECRSDLEILEYFKDLSLIPAVAMQLAVTPCTVNTGSLLYLGKSQHSKDGKKSREAFQKVSLQNVTNLDLPEGYCSFHDLQTVHGAQENQGVVDRILLNFWFFSTDIGHISSDAKDALKKLSRGCIHLRGKDEFKICEHSIVV